MTTTNKRIFLANEEAIRIESKPKLEILISNT